LAKIALLFFSALDFALEKNKCAIYVAGFLVQIFNVLSFFRIMHNGLCMDSCGFASEEFPKEIQKL
jgi:hypothetical protein